MKVTPGDGYMILQFEDVYELNYHILNAIGLTVDDQGYVFDQDTKTQILVSGKRLKASIDPAMTHYAGDGEVMLDPLRNLHQMTVLLGYHIDKKVSNGEITFLSQFIEEPKDREDPRTALTIKYDSCFSVTSGLFTNRCLKFVQMIFIVEKISVDLTNFDDIEGGDVRTNEIW